MEENLNLLQMIQTAFPTTKQDIRTYSPLALAYVGDCVFELIIRTVIMELGNKQPEKLHKQAVKYVNAGTQAKLFKIWEEELTEEEKDYIRRGRNARSYTKAKNATTSDYRKATGVETLYGYLYLTDQLPRAVELLRSGLEKLDILPAGLQDTEKE